jgi:hypothetical protein
MDLFGTALAAVLGYAVGSAWIYTLARAVLLLFIVIVLWRGRRNSWVLLALGLSLVSVGTRVLTDLLTGGAERPWSVYLALTNLSSLLLYLAVGHLLNQVARLRGLRRERDVALTQRDEARAWVHAQQRRAGEPVTIWPPEEKP